MRWTINSKVDSEVVGYIAKAGWLFLKAKDSAKNDCAIVIYQDGHIRTDGNWYPSEAKKFIYACDKIMLEFDQ